ncbi:hypothetical protein EHH44_03730 [Mycolicibacter terrae]|uniref:Uncharacterized protein n=1 Tax=Mycolicibacter terrae TaxID=1788 RepID=A0ACD2ESF6_9MYCO|nr:hypothetical protein EHH44_03730 [Mycolicibacter terrae]
MAVGVALAGAGVIAVNPVAPLIPVAGHQPAVQLTGTWDTAADNWANLQEIFAANPDPIGHAVGELTSYYGDVASNSIKDSLAGVEGIWSGLGGAKGLETILPQVMEFLQQGDVTNAYNLLNNEFLFSTLNVFQPLFDHTPHGGTEEVPGILSMGPDLTRIMANVQDVFLGDFSFWKSGAKYLMEPFIGMQFALADNMTDTGDHVAQDPLDALLNGYVPWDVPDGSTAEDPHAPFIGLLTETGTLYYLFEKLPSMIAEALTANLPVDEVVDPDAGGALADANLFDLDWLTGLFS